MSLKKVHSCFSFSKMYVENCSFSLWFLKPAFVRLHHGSFSYTGCSCLLLYFLTAQRIWGPSHFSACHSELFPFLVKPALLEMSVNSLLVCCSVSSKKIHAGVLTVWFPFSSILRKIMRLCQHCFHMWIICRFSKEKENFSLIFWVSLFCEGDNGCSFLRTSGLGIQFFSRTCFHGEHTQKSVFVSQASVSHIHFFHEWRHSSRDFQENTYKHINTLSQPPDGSLCFSRKSCLPGMVLHRGTTPLFAYMDISWSLLDDLVLWSDICKTRPLDTAFI